MTVTAVVFLRLLLLSQRNRLCVSSLKCTSLIYRQLQKIYLIKNQNALYTTAAEVQKYRVLFVVVMMMSSTLSALYSCFSLKKNTAAFQRSDAGVMPLSCYSHEPKSSGSDFRINACLSGKYEMRPGKHDPVSSLLTPLNRMPLYLPVIESTSSHCGSSAVIA